jgi:hypothetical protein
VTDADDPQFVAEELDPDELPGEGDGVAGGGVAEEYPPTHLSGVNAYGITAGEERVDEPIEERTSSDEPDDLAGVWTPDPPIGCLNLGQPKEQPDA